ncbi:MAG: zinc ABC transporter substrate-binding protein, partial [Clostridia bacterium]|nr:zinc ABC transporter substrate-binding protein [Clostridia bacterium]
MKKNIAGIVALVMLFTFMFAGASLAEEKKINVVTTIFPVYDWVREIVSDSDNVEITMLLDNGVDLHSYQPTAQDIMKVATCDVFAYVGGESDEWVGDALAEAVNPDMVAVNLVEAMGEDIKMEEIVEGMEHEHEDEEHEDEEHEDEEHEDEEHEDEEHEDEEHEDEEHED